MRVDAPRQAQEMLYSRCATWNYRTRCTSREQPACRLPDTSTFAQAQSLVCVCVCTSGHRSCGMDHAFVSPGLCVLHSTLVCWVCAVHVARLVCTIRGLNICKMCYVISVSVCVWVCVVCVWGGGGAPIYSSKSIAFTTMVVLRGRKGHAEWRI